MYHSDDEDFWSDELWSNSFKKSSIFEAKTQERLHENAQISQDKAEEVFLAELKNKRALLWCGTCKIESYFTDPSVSKTVHHYRPGGTTYDVSGYCPQCHVFNWEHFKFERPNIRQKIPDVISMLKQRSQTKISNKDLKQRPKNKN